MFVPAHIHPYAISFYKAKLGARTLNHGQYPVVPQSKLGFLLRVDCMTDAKSSAVRIVFPSNASPVVVAQELAVGAKVHRARTGLMTVDPYGVTWRVS